VTFLGALIWQHSLEDANKFVNIFVFVFVYIVTNQEDENE
jgi:hypothetical protein